MCRSIKLLRRENELAPDEEIRAASLQFVRKIAGYRKPSRVNTEPFELAVDEIAIASQKLLNSLKDSRTAR